MDRVFEPANDERLYHYCSAATFQAITTSGNIRFTDITMLNDGSEMRWAYSVFEEAATRLLNRVGVPPSAPNIERSFLDSIDEIISPIQIVAHPFIASFSLEPDLLGQWRAYADDGRGFSVGFHASALRRQLPATFLKVLYNREHQVREMMVAIVAIHQRKEDTTSGTEAQFLEDRVLLGIYMTSFKHPAFAEEKEVRAVHAINVRRTGNLAKFVDSGGTVADNVEVAGAEVSFQVRDNHLVAFIDSTLTPADTTTPIVELVLGPKNHSFTGNLCLYLGGLGYTDISLRRSSAPYR